MKNQLSLCKEKRNKDLLCTLMDKTFPHRRHLIVKEIIRLQDLMEMYPMLCTEDQVVSSVKFVLCHCFGFIVFYFIILCSNLTTILLWISILSEKSFNKHRQTSAVLKQEGQLLHESSFAKFCQWSRISAFTFCIRLKSKTLRNCLSSSFLHHSFGITGNSEQKNILLTLGQLTQFSYLLR